MKPKNEELEQFNTRVTKPAKQAVKAVSAITSHKQELVVLDAIRVLFGQVNPEVEQRVQEYREAFGVMETLHKSRGSTTCLSYRSGRRLAIA